VGVLVALLAAAIRLQFLEVLELRAAFLTFYPAVAVAALYGGLEAGLTATVVSALLADYFWMEPVGHFAIANFADLISMAVFLASCTLISYLAEAAFRAQARAYKAEEQARVAAERKQAEVLLQRQAELLHLSYDAIIVWQLGGRIESWNKGAEELYGYSQGEAVGQVTHDLLKTIHHVPWPQMEAKLRERKFWEGELKHRTSDGREVIISARHQLVRGADGVERVLETNRDITERKLAELLLQRQAELLHLSYDAIIVWQLGGGIESWNKGAEELYGYSQEEAVGRVTHDLLKTVHPEPWPQMEAKLRESKFWEGELKHRTRDGREVVVSARLQLVRGADGVDRVLETNRDITERKLAEEALRESEDRLQVTLSSIGDAVIAADVFGSVSFLNSVAAALTGWQSEDAFGQPIQSVFRIINEKTRKPAENIVERVLREGNIVGLANHTALITREGREVPIEDSAAPIKDGSGKVIGVVLVFHDVTEKRRAREALRESEERLRLFIGHAPASLAMFDREMRYLSASRRWLTDYNLEQTDLAGLSHYEIFPEIPEYWKEVHRRGLAGEVVSADSDRFDRADGSVQWIRWEVRPWYDAAGDVGGIVIFSEDITERQQLLEKIESAARFPDENPSPVLRISSDGKLLYANRSSAALLKSLCWKPGETVPSDWRQNALQTFRSGSSKEMEVTCEDVVYSLLLVPVGDLGYVNIYGRDITERKRVEGALRESEERFLIAKRAAMLGIHDYDVSSGKIRWDERLRELWAVGPDLPITYEVFMSGIHAGDREEVQRAVEKALDPNGTGKYYSEYRVIGLDDGAQRWVAATGHVFFDQGRAVRLVGTAQDITERKLAESRLTADLAALTRMHALSGRLLETGGIQLLLQEIMDAAVSIVGAEKGTLQLLEGDSLRIVADCGHRQPFLEFFASAENQASVCGEATRRGERVVVSDVEKSSLFIGTPSQAVLREAGVRAVQSTPMMSRSGALLGILTTQWGEPYTPNEHDLWRIDLLARQAADLIEHSHAEEDLRKSEERFRTMVNAIPQLAWIAQADGYIFWYNQRWYDYTGTTPEQMQGWGWQSVHNPETLPDVLERWKDSIATGKPFDMVFPLRGADGSFREFLTRAIPVKNENGEVVQWCGTNTDITEREMMEAELRKSRDELELRVQERTAELNSYMAKLEQSNQALQDFAAIASHDLQEPLRKVTAFGNMLKQKCGSSLGEQGNDYMQRILKANQRMQSLLTALLEYSRLTTKTNPFVEVNLSNLISEVLSDLEIRIAKTGGQVHVGILPVISADPTQMRQLFQNLIGNALKFHKEGEKPLVAIQSSANKQMIRISVEDKGIGFDEKHIERIFAPFQRLHGRSEYEGTGMGLAICKKIVERHGGSITAKSTPGKGSLFVIDLPLRHAGS
jgi:PAS domain S-box-containing protein